MFCCKSEKLSRTQDRVFDSEFSTMIIMFIDLFEIETKFGSYIFSEALFKISDLTRIFEMSTHTCDNSSTFLQSEFFLEEMRVGPIE